MSDFPNLELGNQIMRNLERDLILGQLAGYFCKHCNIRVKKWTSGNLPETAEINMDEPQRKKEKIKKKNKTLINEASTDVYKWKLTERTKTKR